MSRKIAFFISFCCLLLLSVQSGGKSYAAERFDVSLQVLDDGSMRVQETVVFPFPRW